MWSSIESSKYMSTIGTHYDLFQSPRSERSDAVSDSSVLYQISTLKWLFLLMYVFFEICKFNNILSGQHQKSDFTFVNEKMLQKSIPFIAWNFSEIKCFRASK